MRLDQNRWFGGMSVEKVSKGSESTLLKSSSVISSQAKAKNKVDDYREKKILVGLLVCIGVVLWTAAVILRDPARAFKDIVSLFKKAK